MFSIDETIDIYCNRTAGRLVYMSGCYHIEWVNEKGQKWVTEYGFSDRNSAMHVIQLVIAGS